VSLRRRARELGLALGVFLVALAAIVQVRETRHEGGLHSDEPEWIAISILHWRQFVLREPPAGAELDPPEEAWGTPWRRGVQRTTFGYMNPCVPKLVWGAALFAAGHREASPAAFQAFSRGQPQRQREAWQALLPAESRSRLSRSPRGACTAARRAGAWRWSPGRSCAPRRWCATRRATCARTGS
jgi:hypothetical protein